MARERRPSECQKDLDQSLISCWSTPSVTLTFSSKGSWAAGNPVCWHQGDILPVCLCLPLVVTTYIHFVCHYGFKQFTRSQKIHGRKRGSWGYIKHIAERFQLSMAQGSAHRLSTFAIWGPNVCCLEAAGIDGHMSSHWLRMCRHSGDPKSTSSVF